MNSCRKPLCRKDMRPEFDELKNDIVRLGRDKKDPELLAAEKTRNRQAFIQNRRFVVTTASRVFERSSVQSRPV